MYVVQFKKTDLGLENIFNQNCQNKTGRIKFQFFRNVSSSFGRKFHFQMNDFLLENFDFDFDTIFFFHVQWKVCSTFSSKTKEIQLQIFNEEKTFLSRDHKRRKDDLRSKNFHRIIPNSIYLLQSMNNLRSWYISVSY